MLPEKNQFTNTSINVENYREKGLVNLFLFDSKPFREIRVKVGQIWKCGVKKRKERKEENVDIWRESCKFTCYVSWAGPLRSRYMIGYVSTSFYLVSFCYALFSFLTMVFLLSFNLFPKLKEMVKVKTEKNNKVTEESSKD